MFKYGSLMMTYFSWELMILNLSLSLVFTSSIIKIIFQVCLFKINMSPMGRAFIYLFLFLFFGGRAFKEKIREWIGHPISKLHLCQLVLLRCYGVSFFLRCASHMIIINDMLHFCFLKLFHSFINHLLSALHEKGKGTDTHSSLQQVFIESILYWAFCNKMEYRIVGLQIFKQLHKLLH